MALKRTLTPLEDVTLACVLGLVVSGVVYWLMTFAHQGRFYLVWPLTAAGVFVWLHSSKRRSLLRNSTTSSRLTKKARSGRATGQSLSWPEFWRLESSRWPFLPIYYTNFTSQPDGTMRVYPVPDVLFHIAIANELTHTDTSASSTVCRSPALVSLRDGSCGRDVRQGNWPEHARPYGAFCSDFVPRSVDAECFLLLKKLAAVGILRRPRRISRFFRRRLFLYSRVATGRKRRLVPSLL